MIVDVHVHMVGRGDGGTGCFVAPFLRRSFEYVMLLRLLRLGREENLDGAMRERLARWSEADALNAIVVLAQDALYSPEGHPRWDETPFYTPNDYVAGVCRRTPHLLFGASVHPNRRDALQEMDRCVGLGAALLKVHPVIYGIDLLCPRYAEYYRRAASAGLPILVHTGVINSLRPRKRYSGAPECLKRMLDEGATVIAAHAGRASPLAPPYFLQELQRLMERYPRLYADTAALAQPLMFGTLRRLLSDGFWRSMLVHGSDFPIPSVPEPVSSGLAAGRCLGLLKVKNPLLRDLEIKRAMGCPLEVFERGWSLLRRRR